MLWTIREKESDIKRSGYKPLAILRIDRLGSLRTGKREANSGFQTSSPLLGGRHNVSQKCPG